MNPKARPSYLVKKNYFVFNVCYCFYESSSVFKNSWIKYLHKFLVLNLLEIIKGNNRPQHSFQPVVAASTYENYLHVWNSRLQLKIILLLIRKHNSLKITWFERKDLAIYLFLNGILREENRIYYIFVEQLSFFGSWKGQL